MISIDRETETYKDNILYEVYFEKHILKLWSTSIAVEIHPYRAFAEIHTNNIVS